MKSSATRDALQLCISACQRAIKSKTDQELRDHIDTAIREMADAVGVEEIKHTDSGITMEVIPVIIQLMLLSRMMVIKTVPESCPECGGADEVGGIRSTRQSGFGNVDVIRCRNDFHKQKRKKK